MNKKTQLFINNNKNKIIVLFVTLIMLIVLFSSRQTESYSIDRMLRYSFTLQNKTNKTLSNVDFWVYAPVKQTSNQKAVTTTSNLNFESASDELGNEVLHFKLAQLAPYATKVIKLQSQLLLAVKPNNQKIINKDIYISSEKYVEVDAPEIKALSNQFKDSDEVKNAKNTMNWVHQNIKYAGYINDDRGALYALKARKGDCTEYMYLFTALMRSQGIPVRNIGGYVYSQNTVIKAEDFHNWSEIYLDGKWQVVDPQNGKFLEKQNNYISFRVISDKINKNLIPSNSQRFAISSQNISVKIN